MEVTAFLFFQNNTLLHCQLSLQTFVVKVVEYFAQSNEVQLQFLGVEEKRVLSSIFPGNTFPDCLAFPQSLWS